MSRSAPHSASGLHAAFVGAPLARFVLAHEQRQVCQCDLIADSHAAKLAREFARTALPAPNYRELVGDVVLVVSELVTNAVRHGVPHMPHTIRDQTVRLSLIRQAAFVLCMVHDGGITAPIAAHAVSAIEAAHPDPLREAGRGLRIVAELATDWGWTPPDHNGKTVWALFATADQSRGAE